MTTKRKLESEIDSLSTEGSKLSDKSMFWVWIQNAKHHLKLENYKLVTNDILNARSILYPCA